jgi:flagellar basal-body rod modification protein FlgD
MATPISGSTSATAGQAATTSSSASATDRLGKQDFLQLLVAQLRNQDPMKPMEDREFVTQLAQFSALEAMQNLDKRMEAFSSAQLLGQAAGLIGKQVTGTLADGTTLTGPVSEVRMVAGTPRLIVNAQELALDKITTVGG